MATQADYNTYKEKKEELKQTPSQKRDRQEQKSDIFKVLGKKKTKKPCKPSILCLAIISFKSEGEIKNSQTNKKKQGNSLSVDQPYKKC